MTINLELSQQDAETILKFVDIGLKAAGLAALDEAMRVRELIQTAAQSAHAQAQEPKTAPAE